MVQQQTMTLAQDFFGALVEELKQEIKDNRATLEKLPDQIPGDQEEPFQMFFQELMDNYAAIEEALDEAGYNVANLDTGRLVRQGEVEATDAARREARELGVDLTEIEGTGSEGPIWGDRGNVPDSRGNRVQFTHSDRPNTLVGADEHLRFAEEVIKRSGLPKPIHTKLRQQIERIQKRCADPNLYLAVVGEFSSGKSTFINALLRDDLLKTSVLPTTAAATKLRHGTSIGAEALFKNSRLRAVKTKFGNSPDDVRRFIQKVTSEDEVAKEIVDIEITHPASFLANGIVIIDTPGTNAINPRHGEITRRVIENEADAAIIIVPATMPLSQTLAAFLDGPLRPYLHRCLFVITKMSQIPLQDQNKVLDYLRQRLALKLEVDLPVVYPCSAQVVMDELTGDVPVPEHQRVWNERFAKLETLITERLRQERVLSVAENVTRLLTHMFEQLNTHLRAQWNQYQTRQATIKRATIRDLPSFAAEQQAQCNQMLQKAVSDTALRMDRLNRERREKTISKIRSALFGAESEAALNSIINARVQELLSEDQGLFQKDLRRELKRLAQTVTDISNHFDRKFSEEYRRLRILGGRVEVKSRLSDNSADLKVSEVLSSVQSVKSSLDYKDAGILLGGAAAGALIGSFLLPGVGTVIGGLVGPFLGSLSAPSLDERKNKFWDSLAPQLDHYFEDSKDHGKTIINTYKEEVKAALRSRIKTYVTEYSSEVATIRREQETELRKLKSLQHSTKANLSEIEGRRKALVARQQHMAEMKFTGERVEPKDTQNWE